MEIEPYNRQQKDSPNSVDFSNVQIMHKLAGWVIPNIDVQVTVFFNVNYLKNGSR